MTGAKHYAEAERLLVDAVDYADRGEDTDAALSTAMAQVHATLAHAAAVAGEWIWPAGGSPASRQWSEHLDPRKAEATD